VGPQKLNIKCRLREGSVKRWLIPRRQHMRRECCQWRISTTAKETSFYSPRLRPVGDENNYQKHVARRDRLNFCTLADHNSSPRKWEEPTSGLLSPMLSRTVGVHTNGLPLDSTLPKSLAKDSSIPIPQVAEQPRSITFRTPWLATADQAS
jgi:hypothetical protein